MKRSGLNVINWPKSLLLLIALVVPPVPLLAQYNQSKKPTLYTLPGPVQAEAAPLSQNNDIGLPQIKTGADAKWYLGRYQSSEASTVSILLRKDKPVSSTSIDMGIQNQRQKKQPLDLSFLANLGYSLFNRDHLYLQRNDYNSSTIIK